TVDIPALARAGPTPRREGEELAVAGHGRMKLRVGRVVDFRGHQLLLGNAPQKDLADLVLQFRREHTELAVLAQRRPAVAAVGHGVDGADDLALRDAVMLI